MSHVHRLAVIGDGQMGRAIELMAREKGWEVTAVIGMQGNEDGRGITRATLGNAEVAVEFTEPKAAVANVTACLRANCRVVVGTTGWHELLPAVEKIAVATGTPVLWSSNFSTGVNVLLEIATRAGELLKGASGFDAHILETHHARKKDAPSGTAIAIERAVSETLGRAIPVTSVRTGSVPGTHQLIFDAEFEQIQITHIARDRRVFADGALRAAEWLVHQKSAGGKMFTMRDVLGIQPGRPESGR